MSEICSDALSKKENTFSFPSFKIYSFFQPFQNEAVGGDRFGINLLENGSLFFYIADATGHGEMGAKFWQQYRIFFDSCWQKLIKEKPSNESFQAFILDFNHYLLANASKKDSLSSQTCLSFGCISTTGELFFSTCGYGTHVLAQKKRNKPTSYQTKFGLKLGWFSNERRASIPNAFLAQKDSEIERLVLLTDAFLGEDHEDPQRTLAEISQMNRDCVELTGEEIIPYFLNHFDYQSDDTTLVVIEHSKKEL